MYPQVGIVRRARGILEDLVNDFDRDELIRIQQGVPRETLCLENRIGIHPQSVQLLDERQDQVQSNQGQGRFLWSAVPCVLDQTRGTTGP